MQTRRRQSRPVDAVEPCGLRPDKHTCGCRRDHKGLASCLGVASQEDLRTRTPRASRRPHPLAPSPPFGPPISVPNLAVPRSRFREGGPTFGELAASTARFGLEHRTQQSWILVWRTTSVCRCRIAAKRRKATGQTQDTSREQRNMCVHESNRQDSFVERHALLSCEPLGLCLDVAAASLDLRGGHLVGGLRSAFGPGE